MTGQDFIHQILLRFGFAPTADQMAALQTFTAFLKDRGGRAVMILRGSAGTGKTSLAGAMVRTFLAYGQKLMLLAPTGRAAKVFSINSGQPAFTIHRKIYRQQSIEGAFQLNNNLHADTLFMVDEASMINYQPGSAGGGGVSPWGTNGLLDDLVSYVYGGRNCRLMLIGDKAQLPPVGEAEAPALMAGVLEGYGLRVYECDLDEVLRQSADSGIRYNATRIRRMITHEAMTALPKIRFRGFADVRQVSGSELIEQLNDSYGEVGMDETMVVTRSNKRANLYNQGIRNTILDREELLSTGDLVMIVKNKYFDEERGKAPKAEQRAMAFIANGDRAEVIRVRNRRELYGFHFADVTLRFPDYDNEELDETVILEALTSDAPALTQEQGDDLYRKVMEDYADLPLKADRLRALRKDAYFNALQVKFAYAVTCHKAQGGQWAHVYLDQGYMTDDMLTPDYIHWLYTAFTRATERLFLVNWPPRQTEE